MKKLYTFIDLFAGAGGLSEGFINAGFTPVAHVEMNPDACNTLKTRACFHYLNMQDDLEKYSFYLKGIFSRDELYSSIPSKFIDSIINATMNEVGMSEIYRKIDISMKKRGIKKIDLIVGGPPCQAYSLVGRARKNMENDPRNYLFELYCKALEKYEPEMFVFENVPGLLTAGNGRYMDEIVNTFHSAGYNVNWKIINAADFNVLQYRKRIIVIGWKKESHFKYPNIIGNTNNHKVHDILSDLPLVQAGEYNNRYKRGNFNSYLRETGLRKGSDTLTWHIARPHSERDREIYRQVITYWNRIKKRLKYSMLSEELSTHKNKDGFLDRFKVVAGDLSTCHTMMAHISKDGHYYIHPDISQARSITVREAARIQSFPDDYFFEGSRTSAFTQIGNAVPPLMAKNIATAIYGELGDT